MIRHVSPLVRRLVLGGAVLAATLVVAVPDGAVVRAAAQSPTPSTSPSAAPSATQGNAKADAKSAARSSAEAARDAAREARAAAREAAAAAKAAAREARRQAADASVDIDVDLADPQAGRHKGIRIGVAGADREYDSFDQVLDREPELAVGVVAIVFIVFLTPILLIALVIWYKMRKTRLQNETMLKLAEKGVLPPAEAMQAIGAGRADAAIGVAAAPLTEQARAIRKHAAWSDLRKGVLLGAVGLAITFYTMINEQSANWFGLVLLFVGIGYGVLWYFEDQQATAMRSAAPGPGDKPN